MKLALFDLDHTLIPFDSGMAWTRFLVGRGRLPADAEERYLGYCHQYVAGTLDMHAMHRASVLAYATGASHAAYLPLEASDGQVRLPAQRRRGAFLRLRRPAT